MRATVRSRRARAKSSHLPQLFSQPLGFFLEHHHHHHYHYYRETRLRFQKKASAGNSTRPFRFLPPPLSRRFPSLTEGSRSLREFLRNLRLGPPALSRHIDWFNGNNQDTRYKDVSSQNYE